MLPQLAVFLLPFILSQIPASDSSLSQQTLSLSPSSQMFLQPTNCLRTLPAPSLALSLRGGYDQVLNKAWEDTMENRKKITKDYQNIDADLSTLNQSLAQIDSYYEDQEIEEYTENNPKWKLIIPKHFMDPENTTTDLGPKYHPPFPVVPTAAMMDPSTRMRESACRGRTWEVVELMEREGAQVNKADEYGLYAALHWASLMGKNDTVQALIERGGNVSQVTRHGRTPLHYAADQGHIQCASILLNAGADITVKDIDECTPMDLAKLAGHVRVYEMLKSWSNNATKPMEQLTESVEKLSVQSEHE